MATFKPIRQVRVSDEIVDQLKQAILLGRFKAGDKLPAERELAEEFQVSRMALREALRSLKELGFIMTRQGAMGGAYVTDLTFERLVDAFLDLFLTDKFSVPELYRVRLHIEPEVARLAALNVTPQYAERLKDALEAEQLPVTSLTEDIDRKTAIHFILAEMCGNRFFEALIRSLMGLTRRVNEIIEPNPEQPMDLHPAGMHRPVVEAVLSGDPDAAEAAMKHHAQEFGSRLMEAEKAFRERQTEPSI
jgi:GntR family transcriptional regulator, transcriptional repressor for pyruvate dehydrogenase complex